jgi:hypothetical protein
LKINPSIWYKYLSPSNSYVETSSKVMVLEGEPLGGEVKRWSLMNRITDLIKGTLESYQLLFPSEDTAEGPL